jgi:hypothetical protein
VAIFAALLFLTSLHATAVGPSNGPAGTVKESDPDNYDYGLPSPPSPDGQVGAMQHPSGNATAAEGMAPAWVAGPPPRTAAAKQARSSGIPGSLAWWITYLATALR